ncbi:MAG: fibronectin type III domain-containing protein [Clostridiales bacterium]|nr:fibronectin type III domain-containing protein [Clostridiales bacterium]
MYSLNLLFGSTMKLTQGMGISINRYSYLEPVYWLDSLSKYIPTVTKTERTRCTSIKVSRNEVDGATAYSLEYRKQEDTEWSVASYSILTTNYTVTSLTTGSTYCFRVRAFAENEWKDYSTETVKSALPPKPSNITVTAVLSGIQIDWATRKDISGCIVYRSESKNGAYTQLALLDNNTQTSYTDSTVKANKTYYYKIQRFVYVDSQPIYSEISSAETGKYSISAPSRLSVSSKSKTSVSVSWKAVDNATSYTVVCRLKGTKTKKIITTSSLSCTFKGLTLGKKYKIKIKANRSFGSSAYCKAVSITAKPKTPTLSAVRKSGNIKLSWDKINGISGYYVYRAYSKNGKYTLIKTVKGKNNTSCSLRTYSSSKYYYKVKSYVKKGSTVYTSSYSKVFRV